MARSILAPPLENIVTRTKWYVYIRWLALLVITLPTVIATASAHGLSHEVTRDLILTIAALGSNGVFYFMSRLTRSTKYYQLLVLAMVLADIFVITYFIFTKGGIESRSVILYTLPIFMSAITLGRQFVWAATGLAIILYDGIILLDYFGPIHSVGAYNPELRTQLPYVISTIIYFSSIFIIVGLVVNFITKHMTLQEQYALQNLDAMKRAQAIAKLGNWEWNLTQNSITLSDETYRIFGIPKDAPAPSLDTFLEIAYPPDVKIIRTHVQKARKRAQSFRFDHRIRTKRGLRYVHMEGQSFADSTGMVTSLIGTVQDITEMRVLDEAKSDFVSLASHQLRTPASGVKQFLSLLLDGFAEPLTPRQQQLAQVAYDSNERQLRIVDDLLYVAHVDSGKMKMTRHSSDIVSLMQDITTEQRGKFESKSQTITVHSRYKHIFCDIDRQRVRMALENIIDNAHKYTHDGKQIKVRITKEAKLACISVIDQGVGIAKKDIGRLFKKFSRIENPLSTSAGGSGLGLYWAARVIAQNNGKIQVKSKVGTGTEFKILLPVSGDSSTTADAEEYHYKMPV